MKSREFYDVLLSEGLTFFTGVPDSTFGGFVNVLHEKAGSGCRHVAASSECEAVAIASGYYLATGLPAVVYMQNSGEGHAINPLTSLCDKAIYSIPLIMLIGWRGEPGYHDEPQHQIMGKIMLPLLKTLDIPSRIMPDDIDGAKDVISEIKKIASENSCPVALIIRQKTIENEIPLHHEDMPHEMTREDAIKTIIDQLSGSEVIVATTGKTSRELFEYRMTKGHEPTDFYTVGSMGCAPSIGLGIALMKKNKSIYIFDGDGAVIMQMGSLATIGHYKPHNYYHIIFDNSAYDSTGGQPSVSPTLDFDKIASGCGYQYVKTVSCMKDLITHIVATRETAGPVMIIVQVRQGARQDLGRPSFAPVKNKVYFMNYLSK